MGTVFTFYLICFPLLGINCSVGVCFAVFVSFFNYHIYCVLYCCSLVYFCFIYLFVYFTLDVFFSCFVISSFSIYKFSVMLLPHSRFYQSFLRVIYCLCFRTPILLCLNFSILSPSKYSSFLSYFCLNIVSVNRFTMECNVRLVM